jgi:hypothetical protein
LILAATRVAYQGQPGFFIDLDTIHRAGVDACSASITSVFIQLNPIFPGQCLMWAGCDTLVIFTGQTHSDHWHFGPVRSHINAGSFGGILAKVGPGADGHANLTFSAKRAF